MISRGLKIEGKISEGLQKEGEENQKKFEEVKNIKIERDRYGNFDNKLRKERKKRANIRR